MKTFVKAKGDYDEKLIKGAYYEVLSEFDNKYTRSGWAVVIAIDDILEVFDSERFFE